MTRSTVTERDGLFELDAGSDVLDSPRYNHDIAPTKVHERTWNKWHITALWVGMAICVPTYTLGGVLTAYFGLTVGEALLAILGIRALYRVITRAFGWQWREHPVLRASRLTGEPTPRGWEAPKATRRAIQIGAEQYSPRPTHGD